MPKTQAQAQAQAQAHTYGETALVTALEIESSLQAALHPSSIKVEDESWQHAGHAGANEHGVGSHFFVQIASPFFTNTKPVAQHRLVYDALGDLMPRIHALRIEIQ